MSGCLIALAYAAWRPSETVALIEPGNLGGSFGQGGFQYLRNSEGVRGLLQAHGLPYALREQAGGVLTHKGRVLAYPAGLGTSIMAAQRLHYAKTRGSLDGFTGDVMNFGGVGGEQVLVDISRLLGKVADTADVFQASARVVSGSLVSIAAPLLDAEPAGSRQWIEAGSGTVISTIPLGLLGSLLQLDLPERPVCPHEWLKVVRTPLTPEIAPLGHYDYTYTPWLGAIHRVRPVHIDGEVLLEAEWNDTLTGKLPMDLKKLGITDHSKPRLLPGHLHPVAWGTWRPDASLRLAGRFAQWEPRMTVDKVVDVWHKELT
jgi:hypothetical protein